MANLQNVVIARPRLLWGDKVNLAIILIFQVLAVIVLVTTPFLAQNWLHRYPEFSNSKLWIYLYIPYILGLVFLVSSVWVISQRRFDSVGQVYSLFATAAAIGLFCLFDAYTSQRLLTFWIIATALCGGALINLGLIYPEQAKVNRQYPGLRYVGYLPALVLILIALFIKVYSGYHNSFATIWLLDLFFLTLALVFFLGSILIRRLSSPSPMVREQARLIIWGSGIAFGPLLLWLLMRILSNSIQLSPILFLSLGAFPVVLAHTILRYRLLDADSFVKQGIVYGTLLVLVAGSYALLVSGLSIIVGYSLGDRNPILIGMVVFLIAIILFPVRTNLQRRLDTAFFRGNEIYQERLQAFSHELTRSTEISHILRLLKEYVEDTLSPGIIYIYTIDDSKSYYVAAPDEDEKSNSDIRFARNGALVELLTKRGGTIFLGDGDNLPEKLMVDQARLALIRAQLFVPIRGQSGLGGWLALGERQSGESYSAHDINYLESLCDQASLALERSQVVTALERRVHEMDTITKVAEEINQKSALDELLDMFYSETRSLVPTVDFRITLKVEPGENFYHVFYIADNRRIKSRENNTFGVDQSLEAEVIRNQRAIVTFDYAGECKRRGLIPESENINAWMSVPLNSGSRTIGAVSLGSRDPEILYTSEQVDLLQAIGDLVAGAIVKARLLEESQRQARQMATLNELARSLTSTLELEPLLNRIMQSAVEIIECEAGSLLLVDEESGESVFEVATGPVGSDLIGRRLPPGAGVVGKAIVAKQAIIENQVKMSGDWFNTDEMTGFLTKDLLVVPLVVKDRAIGVLEVLNKKDTSPFTLKDQELLTAFAGQAAVAIENARLYTQTDQALAARVDELSLMQDIDRELNTSLDVTKVMSITLDSALYYSASEAGLIGTIEGNELYVKASSGYHVNNLDKLDKLHIRDLPGLQQLLEEYDPQPWLLQFGPGNDNQASAQMSILKNDQKYASWWELLPAAMSRILVPIKWESSVIGIIFLESSKRTGFTKDSTTFLSRLSDHAAIAISNAQLYDQVQRASKSKSEFVSSAAHELKNPLTSIKGYSDLLVGGAVGPISEKQANFLTTIRSNAERMGTLVSDLQDISRIEAGQLVLKFSMESLAALIEEVVNSLKKSIDDKSQQLDIQLPDDLPRIWCDNTRLIQVLTNLLSNAHKYSPPESRIRVTAEVQIAQKDKSSVRLVHVSVIDNGIGISSEDQEKIFQQFFRSEDKYVRETTGTGLGLSITKKLVEMQGGELWFESQIGQGTRFHFTIATDPID
ncbi:MAG: GAF domain-containing protein [Anaerolineales bacterium]